MTQVQKLKSEITNLSSNWSQAIDEMDGLLWKVNELLNSLSNADWNKLNIDLPNWENEELSILAETICSGNDGKDIVEHHDTLGYIFTLMNDNNSSTLLTNEMFDFLNEYQITSSNLIDKMKIKIAELTKNQYLNDTEQSKWISILNQSQRKASR